MVGIGDKEQRRRGNEHSEGEENKRKKPIPWAVDHCFSKKPNMAKSQNSKKQTKKLALKTPAEKKAAKRDKKNAR